MRRFALILLCGIGGALAQQSHPLLQVQRVHVDRLAGGEGTEQIRALLIASLQASGLFTITENPERADAFLRGAAEDVAFSDLFQSQDSISMRASTGGYGSGAKRVGSAGVSVGENESTRIVERKHEAMATVRLVDRNGDVLWSTTQESGGAKFRGAGSDVAEKVIRQLLRDMQGLRSGQAGTAAQFTVRPLPERTTPAQEAPRQPAPSPVAAGAAAPALPAPVQTAPASRAALPQVELKDDPFRNTSAMLSGEIKKLPSKP